MDFDNWMSIIALGLLISELNSGYLHNKIMTFSIIPVFINIEGETLRDKIKSIVRAPFGLNTNFLNIADLIISKSLSDTSFIYKKIICLTDMQFDAANSINENENRNIHNIFMNKFKNNNLEIPELIYWNLSSKYNNFPINTNYENTSIISGYSEQLLNVILNDDKINPLGVQQEGFIPHMSGTIYSNIATMPRYDIPSGAKMSGVNTSNGPSSNNVYNIDIALNGTTVTADDVMRSFKRELALVNAKEGIDRRFGGNH